MREYIPKIIVPIEEIKSKNRNEYVFIILTLFFGPYGLHRIYLKDYILGILIFSITIYNINQNYIGIVILIIFFYILLSLVYLVKAGKYSYLRRKSRKVGSEIEVTESNNNNSSDFIFNDKAEPKNKSFLSYDTKLGYIIDITNTKPSELVDIIASESKSKPKFTSLKTQLTPFYPDEPPQVIDATMSIVDELLQFLDEDNAIERVSSMRATERTELVGYIQNYTYSMVREHYSKHKFYYNSNGKRIQEFLGYDYFNKFDKKLKDDLKKLPLALPETNKYFNLTTNGLNPTWWDMTGEIREKIEFSDLSEQFLNYAEKRSNKAWEKEKFRRAIIIEFQKFVNKLNELLKLEKNATIKKNAKLINFIDDKSKHNAVVKRTATSLLVISENIVRESVSELSAINIESRWQRLKNDISIEVFNELKEQYKRQVNERTTVNNEVIFPATERKKIDLNLEKISKSREENKAVVKIVSDFLDGQEDIFEKENVFTQYINLIESGEEIDDHEIDLSENTNNRETNPINIDTPLEISKEPEITIDPQQTEFINMLIDGQGIDNQMASVYAMEKGTFLNTFVSDINNTFYEEVEDTVIIVEDNLVFINEDYLDYMKGVVNNDY
ncbi:hypothetical protein HZY88_08720 [Aerococcaceae bacterium DSM 111176]|nr:hypothetical protein [Aerococcaceae bacterium DSM 111176]